jgi:hypothetical protein
MSGTSGWANAPAARYRLQSAWSRVAAYVGWLSTCLQSCARAVPSLVKGVRMMSNDREKILNALREKPLKVFEVMKRVNIANEEACQSLLMKMRSEGLVKFDIHKGLWLIG